MSEAARLIMHFSVFDELAAAQKRLLLNGMRNHSYQAKEIVYSEQDEPSDRVYVVVSGYLKASCTDAAGVELVFSILGPGDSFGELSMLDGQPRGATISAITAAEVVSIAGNAFQAALDASPALARSLLKTMGVRLRSLASRCQCLLSTDVSQRLAMVLSRLSQKFGTRDAQGAIHLPFRISQQDLGAMVGATRESVNKCLREWTLLGLVRHHRGRLVVCDPAALEHWRLVAPATGSCGPRRLRERRRGSHQPRARA